MAATTSCLTSLVRPAAFSSFSSRQPAKRAQRCVVRAEEDKSSLSFQSNKRAALGFTESDSAGQTNVFAVEPKTYVAGSTADATSAGAKATFIISFVASMLALAFVGGGLLTVSTAIETLDSVAPTGQYASLSQYSQAFASQGAPALDE